MEQAVSVACDVIGQLNPVLLSDIIPIAVN